MNSSDFIQNITKLKFTKNCQTTIHSPLQTTNKAINRIINEESRKFTSYAFKNGLSKEDLQMYSLFVLLELCKRFEMKLDAFTPRENRYFKVMLNRKLRDYANQDIRIRRVQEDGNRCNFYMGIDVASLDTELVSLEFDQNARSYFMPTGFTYEKSPEALFLKGRKTILTNSQNVVFDALQDNNMNITQTAKELGKQRSSIERTMKNITKRLEKAFEDQQEHTRLYSKLLKTQQQINTLLEQSEELHEEYPSEKQYVQELVEKFVISNVDTEFMQSILYDKLGYYTFDGNLTYKQALYLVGELINYSDNINLFPYKYRSDLKKPESSYGKQHNKEVKERYKEASKCSTVKVFDKDGNLLDEYESKPTDYNVRYGVINSNGVELVEKDIEAYVNSNRHSF